MLANGKSGSKFLLLHRKWLQHLALNAVHMEVFLVNMLLTRKVSFSIA